MTSLKRTTPSLPAPTRKDLHNMLVIAREVCIDESTSDAAYNASRYDEWVAAGLVTVAPEDRGDGIERVRISPTAAGRLWAAGEFS